MDAFQANLDALQKQSKEQITAAMGALRGACNDGIQPVRIAVVIGNRLTPAQIATSFPVLCLIDAMLTIGKEEIHIAEVLEEFWLIAPSLFTNYAVVDEALRDKVCRTVKRWGGKKMISLSLSEKLLAAMSGKVLEVRDGEDDNAGHAVRSADGARGANDTFTNSEVSGFCSILQNSMKIIERLPPHRARMYLEVAQKEISSRTPSKSALLFLQGLHAELNRESAVYNGKNIVKDEHQSSTIVNSDADTKTALSSLLDKLSKEQASSGPVDNNNGHIFHVIRYTSPLHSDICQRLSLAQRSGFGEWHRKDKNEYHYPKKESDNRKVFRAATCGQRGSRTWFPTEQQWVSESDMATLTLFRAEGVDQIRESSSVYNVVRKRERGA